MPTFVIQAQTRAVVNFLLEYCIIDKRLFSQLLLIQPTTNAKWSLNRRDNNPSNDTRRCWYYTIFIDGKTNPVVKVVVGPTLPFIATDWRWCWTPKRLKVHLPTFTTGFVLPSIKIVYYQHLLVSFEGLLSLRLSDHFALVVGCINNNWLNLWKKMRIRCSQAFRLLSKRLFHASSKTKHSPSAAHHATGEVVLGAVRIRNGIREIATQPVILWMAGQNGFHWTLDSMM